PLLVEDVALDEPDGASGLDHAAERAELPPHDGLHEVDLELERREALAELELARVGDAHRRVGDVAEDAAVERAHRVPVSLIGLEADLARAPFDPVDSEPDELADVGKGHGAQPLDHGVGHDPFDARGARPSTALNDDRSGHARVDRTNVMNFT